MKIERQFAEVRASNEDRKVKFIFSTDSKDRHGTRINPDGWRLDNFNKNGIASFQHRAYGDPDPDMVIGRAQAWKSDGRLVGTIDFEQEDVNPLAEKLYKKVKAGTLNAVSVGFVEHDGHWGQDKDRGHPDEEKDTYYFDDIELMEISLVTVPSNPEALAYRTFEATGVQKWVQTHTEAPEFQTDLTDEVINTNKMEKEKEKDLAPETSKVEVKLDTSGLKEAIVEGMKEGQKQTQPEPLPGPPAPEVTEEEKKAIRTYSVRKAILQKAYPDESGNLDGLELEMHQQAAKEARDAGRALGGVGIPTMFTRATLQATVDAAGGYTVATELPGFIDTLKNNMASVKAGATLMTGLNGDISIPKLSANSTASWRTELGTSRQSDPTFTAVTMTPHRLTTYTVFSQQLLRQSSLDIEAIVRNNLFYSVANALETAAMEGDGNSQVPQGILNAGVNDATHGSSEPTLASWANIVNMEKMVAVDNALAAKMAYIMKATAAAKLKTTEKASSTGQFIYGQDPLLGGTVNGYPAYVSNVFTDDTVIYGNWADLMIGQWGGIDLIVNPYAGDIYATVRVVIAGYYDIALKHAESFARIDDLKV
jgi:HK97 family phage major capsid protein/HK97 family phage prohead protease